MGSPYQICDIKLTGDWIPSDLDDIEDWVNVKGRSQDGRYLALAYWNTKDNQPGFHVAIIDAQARKLSVSERLPGCCESLQFRGDKLRWTAFPALSGELDYVGAVNGER